MLDKLIELRGSFTFCQDVKRSILPIQHQIMSSQLVEQYVDCHTSSIGPEKNETHSSSRKAIIPSSDFVAGWRLYLAFGSLCVLTLVSALDATSLSVALPVSLIPGTIRVSCSC